VWSKNAALPVCEEEEEEEKKAQIGLFLKAPIGLDRLFV
jgi:hypothetical protein